ncbi:MAG TPA: hypothetical protein VEB20_05630 [Azospirillaceae bacterium]|nr:hypothetical protein [Azospirillaceae bacterium]
MSKRLTGAALAERLAAASQVPPGQPEAPPPAPVPPAPAPAAVTAPARPAARPPSPPPAEKGRGGRPPKAGADGYPLTLRVDPEMHRRLLEQVPRLMVPGRPMPTVQDIARRLITIALDDPRALARLVPSE